MTAENNKIYLYPIWLRIWHGINAIGIILLILTGIRLQYSELSLMPMDFKLAVQLHNIFGIIVTVNYFVFFIGNLITPNKKYYKIKPKGLVKRITKQVDYYISGLFKGEESPFPISEKRKFNPLQKYAYIFVMYVFVPVAIATGIALLFPELIIEKVYSVSGIFLTAVLHGSVGFLISIFLLIHIYVASIGKNPLDNFRSIINGYHDVHPSEKDKGTTK
ncbi:cytochrome b/b6 domain-containing protein [uncultured Sunxiuqinia sp.]|uniref:cytochrome b/b6 domain-containing protein n=1 Tax=uncultured Sunxiuqinia sp. TaxID=1573825 RepID=UPI0030DDB0B7|tara:strand:- start:7694 stop:8350 length:657 start_codon:yes stop_codon:yes gene_type:complete